MALTIATECAQGALNGITATLDGGNFQLRASNNFILQSASGASRIAGTVGVGSGSGDLEVSDNVIPGDATEVTCTGGLQLSLLLS